MLGIRPPLGRAQTARGRMGGRTGGGLNGADEEDVGRDALLLLMRSDKCQRS